MSGFGMRKQNIWEVEVSLLSPYKTNEKCAWEERNKERLLKKQLPPSHFLNGK